MGLIVFTLCYGLITILQINDENWYSLIYLAIIPFGWYSYFTVKNNFKGRYIRSYTDKVEYFLPYQKEPKEFIKSNIKSVTTNALSIDIVLENENRHRINLEHLSYEDIKHIKRLFEVINENQKKAA